MSQTGFAKPVNRQGSPACDDLCKTHNQYYVI